MNKKFGLCLSRIPLLTAFSIFSLHTNAAQPIPGGVDIAWLSSVDAGFKEARRTGKPLLVMFRCVP